MDTNHGRNSELSIVNNSSFNISITFFDLTGQVIYEDFYLRHQSLMISDQVFEKGFYVVMLEVENLKNQWFKLIIQ